MRKTFLLFIVFVVGVAGLVACGQVPESQPGPQEPPQANPTPGPSPVSGIPLAPQLAPPAGETVLQDDFSGPLGQGWAVLDTPQTPGEQAYWSTQDGLLVQGGTTLGMESVDPAYLMVKSGTDWTDYTVRASIYVESNDEVGLIFRVNDAGFYRLRMRSVQFTGPAQMALDLYQNRQYTVLWEMPGGGFPLRQWFSLQIQVSGKTFTISIDGQELAVVQDSTFSTGGIGLFAWSEGGAFFDNVIVTR